MKYIGIYPYFDSFLQSCDNGFCLQSREFKSRPGLIKDLNTDYRCHPALAPCIKDLAPTGKNE